MEITLTPELERYLQEKVESGAYHSASEVVRAALQLLRERDHVRQWRLEELRRELSVGLEELERGDYTIRDNVSLGSLFDEIKERGRSRLEAGQE